MNEIIISTTEEVPGYEVEEVLGIVHASSVRARSIIRDITAGVKNIVGGRIKEYEELLEQTRAEVLEKLKEKAKNMGANGILMVRFGTASIMNQVAEVYAYGTAVKLRKKNES